MSNYYIGFDDVVVFLKAFGKDAKLSWTEGEPFNIKVSVAKNDDTFFENVCMNSDIVFDYSDRNEKPLDIRRTQMGVSNE